jgi:hypothetical protein
MLDAEKMKKACEVTPQKVFQRQCLLKYCGELGHE